MRAGFKQSDTDGDGFLNRRELAAVVSNRGQESETTADATHLDDAQHAGDTSSSSDVGGGL